MSIIALQVERQIPGSVAVLDSVVFDTFISSLGNIGYDNGSGEVTINVPGRYLFQWWVVTQSSISGNGSVFTLVSDQGHFIRGNNISKTGQVSGMGIITVTSPPVKVSLVNYGADAYYSNVPVKAGLSVFGEIDDRAYGALLTVTGDIPLTMVPVNLTLNSQSPASEYLNLSNPDTIGITISGNYRVSFSLTGTIADPTADITVTLINTGIPVLAMTQTLTFTAGNTATFALTNFLPLSQGQFLFVHISSNPDVVFHPATGVAGVLALQLVG